MHIACIAIRFLFFIFRGQCLWTELPKMNVEILQVTRNPALEANMTRKLAETK